MGESSATEARSAAGMPAEAGRGATKRRHAAARVLGGRLFRRRPGRPRKPSRRAEGKPLLRPENVNKHYEALFVEIDSGQIKLPMFQRDFVWDKEQTAKLVDSILRGFPIGTFIFWRTRDELRSYREIGNRKLPRT